MQLKFEASTISHLHAVFSTKIFRWLSFRNDLILYGTAYSCKINVNCTKLTLQSQFDAWHSISKQLLVYNLLTVFKQKFPSDTLNLSFIHFSIRYFGLKFLNRGFLRSLITNLKSDFDNFDNSRWRSNPK